MLVFGGACYARGGALFLRPLCLPEKPLLGGLGTIWGDGRGQQLDVDAACMSSFEEELCVYLVST